VTAFSIQIGNHPVSFPELNIFQLQGSSFRPSQAAADQDSDHGPVSPLFRGRRRKCADQAPTFLGREPVADSKAEPASALDSANAGSQIRTQEATI
jgi:hypothetical protein